MRLGFNWPRGPLELTELLGAEPARSSCSKPCAPSMARPTAGPGLIAGRGPSVAPSQAGPAYRGAIARAGAPPTQFEQARRGLVAPFDPPRVEDERRPRRLGARVL